MGVPVSCVVVSFLCDTLSTSSATTRCAFSAPVVVNQRSWLLIKKVSGLYFSTLPKIPTLVIDDCAGPWWFAKEYSSLG